MPSDSRPTRDDTPAQKNVQTIAEIERQALHDRSPADRLSDAITGATGRMEFAIVQASWCTLWMIINLGYIPGITPFDPFPFNFLTLIVSLEAILLSIIVLMSQNRMMRHADKRAHLNLQVDLLAEQEMTTMLELQRAVCLKLGIEIDPKVRPLLKKTDVHELVDALDHELPAEQGGPMGSEKPGDGPGVGSQKPGQPRT